MFGSQTAPRTVVNGAADVGQTQDPDPELVMGATTMTGVDNTISFLDYLANYKTFGGEQDFNYHEVAIPTLEGVINASRNNQIKGDAARLAFGRARTALLVAKTALSEAQKASWVNTQTELQASVKYTGKRHVIQDTPVTHKRRRTIVITRP
jgi:hypothetical protein